MGGPAQQIARSSGGTKPDRSEEGRGRNASRAEDAEGEGGDEAEQGVVGSIEQMSEDEGKREDPRRRCRQSASAAMGDRKEKNEGDRRTAVIRNTGIDRRFQRASTPATPAVRTEPARRSSTNRRFWRGRRRIPGTIRFPK